MPISSEFSINETESQYTIHLGQKVLFTIKKDDRLSLKIAIISMVNIGLATRAELARAFHLRRQTIFNYLKAYKKSGVAGLIDHRPGPRDLEEKIEKRVVELLTSPEKRVQIPQIIANEFGRSISRTKIYQIRKKHKNKIEESQLKGSPGKKK